MIRTDRYKYNHNHGSRNELYDLQQDPGENMNRIDDAALDEVRNDLHRRLVSWYNAEANEHRNTGAQVWARIMAAIRAIPD
jgi:arylsulfatase A-like enzyme